MDIFAICGNDEKLKEYINHGNDYKVKNNGWTVLHQTAKQGHYESMRLLLEAAWKDYGSAENIRCFGSLVAGETPLSLAAAKGHWLIVDLLVHLYASCSAQETGYALYKASRQAQTECIRVLVNRLPEHVNAINHLTHMFPIHAAASSNAKVEVIILLIEFGANVNARYKINGRTAMHFAAFFGHADIVRTLLAADANPLLAIIDSAPFITGRTPLAEAAGGGNLKIVEMLADVTPKVYGEKAIVFAALMRKNQCLSYLLENGFSTFNSSSNHRTQNHWVHILFSKKAASDASEENLEICTTIKILIENGTSFHNLANSHKSFVIPTTLGKLHKYALKVFLDHGLIEMRHSCSSFPKLADIIQSFEHTKNFPSIPPSKIMLSLAYFPFVKLSNYSLMDDNDIDLTSASLAPVVPTLKELCRWHIRCCIIRHDGFVCFKQVASLFLPNTLKIFLSER